jgi:hypothetical protein
MSIKNRKQKSSAKLTPTIVSKMDLTQDQYDKLLANYIEQIVDGMDLDSLIQFASDMLEQNLRESCSTPDELIEEISQFYDEDDVNGMIQSVVE